MIKRTLFTAALSLFSFSATAGSEPYFSVGLGSFDYGATYKLNSSFIDRTLEVEDDGGMLILSAGLKDSSNKRYGISLSLPNSEEDDIFFLEGFGRFLVNDFIYLGGLAGYQHWESSSDGAEIDFSGLTIGLTGGIEFNNFDINLSHRIFNGGTAETTLRNTDIEGEIDYSTQISVSYQF